MYPHRIRLRGPWDYEPLDRPGEPTPAPGRMTMPCRWAEGGLTDFRGRVRFRRRFGYPGRIDPHERVWLTFAGVTDRAAVRLNDTALGCHAGDGPFEFEVTSLLNARNELVVEVEGESDGGLWGEVALEVRCTAYLRGVRLWAEEDTLHAVGQVVGTAGGPLELYLLLDRSTVAYATITPSAAGAPFHLTGGNLGEGEKVRRGKVDLVNGAVVWHTVEREVRLGSGDG